MIHTWSFLAADAPATTGVSPVVASIIGVAGALLGTLLTGIFAAIQAASQRKSLEQQAKTQQRYETQRQRLELRRQAYVDFVTAVERMREAGALAARAIVDDRPASVLEQRRDAFVACHADAFRLGQLVCIEGPAEVVVVARKINSVGLNAREQMVQLVADVSTNPDVDPSGLDESTQQLNQYIGEFLTAASAVVSAELAIT